MVAANTSPWAIMLIYSEQMNSALRTECLVFQGTVTRIILGSFLSWCSWLFLWAMSLRFRKHFTTLQQDGQKGSQMYNILETDLRGCQFKLVLASDARQDPPCALCPNPHKEGSPGPRVLFHSTRSPFSGSPWSPTLCPSTLLSFLLLYLIQK